MNIPAPKFKLGDLVKTSQLFKNSEWGAKQLVFLLQNPNACLEIIGVAANPWGHTYSVALIHPKFDAWSDWHFGDVFLEDINT